MKNNSSDKLSQWLKDEGYTHCFFIAGGNIMHILNSLRKDFVMVPFVHEVATTMACEYFNLTAKKKKLHGKAFCLVTAGPGVTNAMTGVAGSHIESRELLIIGGQVKTSDLSRGLRQRGIQEIDGVSLMEPITKKSIRLEKPINEISFKSLCRLSATGRPGSVFIEIPLDVQASNIKISGYKNLKLKIEKNKSDLKKFPDFLKKLKQAKRPIILLGGGVQGNKINDLHKNLSKIGIPIQTTWNGIDLIDSNFQLYYGRPNTWGQRYANLIIQQADFIISIGSRLGLQQTGFNWKEFGKNAFKVMVDIDKDELNKGHPHIDIPINSDSTEFLKKLFTSNYGFKDTSSWINYCTEIKNHFHLSEDCNKSKSNFINPYDFSILLSEKTSKKDTIIPCSSGSANTTVQQAFLQKSGQVIMNTKGMASMGYGLSGAIGASLKLPKNNTILIEGDGGFIQNMQELGTVEINKLNLKIFIFFDNGYASIRMTQKNYFGGAYVGCDEKTGLGMPNWKKLAKTYNMAYMLLSKKNLSKNLDTILNTKGPFLSIIPIDPKQTYFPKITSRITKDGSMESNPLHEMTPEITREERKKYMQFIGD